MALKKSRAEIEELAKQKMDLMKKDDISGSYSDIFVGLSPEDLEVTPRGIKKMEKVIENAKDKVLELNITDLTPSPKNMYGQAKGEKREEMKGSLESFGQITPIIVRPRDFVENYKELITTPYEILVGHTRTELLKEIGKDKVKAIVVNVGDVDATLLISQSNIQRESVSDIEIARAYKATYDALKLDKNANLYNQEKTEEKNKDVEISTIFSKPQNGTSRENPERTDEIVARKYGISKNTLRRKMALANCSNDMVKLYKQRKVTQEQIQHLSKISEEAQNLVAEIIRDENLKMSNDLSRKLIDTYENVLVTNKLEKSLPINPFREAIRANQEGDKKENEKSGRKNKGNKKGLYHVPDKLFPKEIVDIKEREKYLVKAIEFIQNHEKKISEDIEV